MYVSATWCETVRCYRGTTPPNQTTPGRQSTEQGGMTKREGRQAHQPIGVVRFITCARFANQRPALTCQKMHNRAGSTPFLPFKVVRKYEGGEKICRTEKALKWNQDGRNRNTDRGTSYTRLRDIWSPHGLSRAFTLLNYRFFKIRSCGISLSIFFRNMLCLVHGNPESEILKKCFFSQFLVILRPASPLNPVRTKLECFRAAGREFLVL